MSNYSSYIALFFVGLTVGWILHPQPTRITQPDAPLLVIDQPDPQTGGRRLTELVPQDSPDTENGRPGWSIQVGSRTYYGVATRIVRENVTPPTESSQLP